MQRCQAGQGGKRNPGGPKAGGRMEPQPALCDKDTAAFGQTHTLPRGAHILEKVGAENEWEAL